MAHRIFECQGATPKKAHLNIDRRRNLNINRRTRKRQTSSVKRFFRDQVGSKWYDTILQTLPCLHIPYIVWDKWKHSWRTRSNVTMEKLVEDVQCICEGIATSSRPDFCIAKSKSWKGFQCPIKVSPSHSILYRYPPRWGDSFCKPSRLLMLITSTLIFRGLWRKRVKSLNVVILSLATKTIVIPWSVIEEGLRGLWSCVFSSRWVSM